MKRQTGRGIIIHSGKILLMERWRDGLHYFSIPGGGVEADETPAQAAEREIEEELGVNVKIGRQLYEVTIDGFVHHIFWCDYQRGEPALHPDSPEALVQSDHNRHKPRWVPAAEVKKMPFVYWQPLKAQLIHDLRHGFDNKIIHISA